MASVRRPKKSRPENPAPEPAPAYTPTPRTMTPSEKAERDASVKDEMTGIGNSLAREAAHFRSLPLSWDVTETEILLYHSHYRLTLDEVLAQELADASPKFDDYDRAIWQGGRLMAVIRTGRNGMLEVVRFDD